MPRSSFTHAPNGWSHEEAAIITTAGLTAWRALVVNGGLKAGDTVLVLGTGGVSIAALQLARAMGATVIATSSSDEKRARLGALGAAHTINYKTHPDWGTQARLHGLIVGNRTQQQDYVRALEATGIRPVIDSSFALEKIAEAFRHEASGRHFGKICLSW